ncbi:hypothetical protein FACS1894189_0950 [Planctomycetales bacterium]|nr:hypothetical protein FACS1894189_0950 [Planctomycetales bacterium]
MTDLQTLERLVEKSQRDGNLTKFAREEYRKLIDRFPEDGFEIDLRFLPDGITAVQENALDLLEKQGYIKLSFEHHGSEGFSYRIDLRGEKFLSEPTVQPDEPAMADSGKREQFSTGAVRDTADGKPRPDLISPFAMERLGEWLRLGAEKYTPRNWEKGISISRTTASMYRHLLKFQQGARDEDHIVAVMCNAMMIIHTVEMVKRGVLPEELLDMPDYGIPPIHFNKDEPYDV